MRQCNFILGVALIPNYDKVLIPIMKYDVINNIQNIDIIENFITRLELPKDYLEYDNNADTILNKDIQWVSVSSFGFSNLSKNCFCFCCLS